MSPCIFGLDLIKKQFASTIQWMGKLMPIAFEFYAIAGRDKEVRQFLKEYFIEYRTLLTRLIEPGITQGEFRDLAHVPFGCLSWKKGRRWPFFEGENVGSLLGFQTRREFGY